MKDSANQAFIKTLVDRLVLDLPKLLTLRRCSTRRLDMQLLPHRTLTFQTLSRQSAAKQHRNSVPKARIKLAWDPTKPITHNSPNFNLKLRGLLRQPTDLKVENISKVAAKSNRQTRSQHQQITQAHQAVSS
jgi:hypothetical protein